MTLPQLLQLVLLGAGAGVVAAGAAAAVRALPWPRPWTKKKPLGCPTCLGFWGSAVTVPLALAMGAAPELGSAVKLLGAGVALLGASTAIAASILLRLFPPPLSDRFDDDPPPAAPPVP